MKDEHGYAKQFLAQQEIELYIGDKRILEWEGSPNYKLYEYKTIIEQGEPLSDTGEKKIITSYKDLLRLGFMITSKQVEYDERTYKGQKVIYELVYKNPSNSDVGEIPRRSYPHWVEYDTEEKRVRLIGNSAGVPKRPGRGPWISLPEKTAQPKKKAFERGSFLKYLDEGKVKKVLHDFQRKLAPVEEAPKMIEIKDIPFMITGNNEIVCLENGKDPPVVGAVGRRGSGKTMVIHTLVDSIYNKDKGRIVIFNDRQRQFLTWSLPNSVEGFNRELQKLMHLPTPLPCIYLYPNDFNLGEIDFEEEGIGFKISLPYKSVLDNYKYFFQGRKNWDLGGSERYFKSLKNYFKQKKDLDGIKDVLDETIGKKKGLKGTYEKILRTMEDLFDTKLMDVNTNIHSKWKIKYGKKDIGEFFPISAALSCGLIPIVENIHLYNKEYYPQYMRWLIQDLYENLVANRLPYDDRTWMVVDEIGQIYKKSKKRTVAAEALIDSITEGRKPNLACLYTLQSWIQVDEEIQLNTSDVLAFNTNQSKDVSELTSAFSLDKHEKEELKNLKTFECMAMTKSRFVVYDIDGNKYHTDEVLKGRIIFPTSQHSKVGQ